MSDYSIRQSKNSVKNAHFSEISQETPWFSDNLRCIQPISESIIFLYKEYIQYYKEYTRLHCASQGCQTVYVYHSKSSKYSILALWIVSQFYVDCHAILTIYVVQWHFLSICSNVAIFQNLLKPSWNFSFLFPGLFQALFSRGKSAYFNLLVTYLCI